MAKDEKKKREPTAYQKHLKKRTAEGLTLSQAQAEWSANKAKNGGTTMASSHLSGTVTDLTQNIRMIVDAHPDEAMAITAAEGIFDFFADEDDLGSLKAASDAAYARAEGDESKTDTQEHAFGMAMGQALEHVLVRRGVDPRAFRAFLNGQAHSIQPVHRGGGTRRLDQAPEFTDMAVPIAGAAAGAALGGPQGAVVGAQLGETFMGWWNGDKSSLSLSDGMAADRRQLTDTQQLIR